MKTPRGKGDLLDALGCFYFEKFHRNLFYLNIVYESFGYF